MCKEPTNHSHPIECCCVRNTQTKKAIENVFLFTGRTLSGDAERWGAGVETQEMYGERLGDGVEYHSMKPTPRRQVPFTTGPRFHEIS